MWKLQVAGTHLDAKIYSMPHQLDDIIDQLRFSRRFMVKMLTFSGEGVVYLWKK